MTTVPVGERNVGLSAEIDARLNTFFAERIAVSAQYGSDYERLWAQAAAASDGGKRIRPRFVLSAFEAFGGSDADAAAAVDVAVAFELLHTAFLLHDDVIDRDTVRRGRLNLSGSFASDAVAAGVSGDRSRLWGEAAAILAGDLLIHSSQSLVARLDLAADVRGALLDVLDHSILVTAAGELADVSFSIGMTEARLPDILAMTERKTATYSFAGPLSAGAILAGADGDALAVLAEYGRLLGVAFQLGDDLLGVFGAEDVTGKSVVSDLREGKETSLIAYARATAWWPEIGALFGRRDLTDTEGRSLADALEVCGARSFVENLVDDYAGRAIALVETSGLPAALGDELARVARSCVGRIS